MALNSVTYACGHTDHRVQLYGKMDERTRRINWLKTRVCTACYSRGATTPMSAPIDAQLDA